MYMLYFLNLETLRDVCNNHREFKLVCYGIRILYNCCTLQRIIR